ncbi:MAG: DUF1540 domain-containing protein [Clostridiales bacterium]|nr:DUF1540 domain-containing protein [Clostridiales bacterium]
MKFEMAHQEIKCDVNSCKYNESRQCDLNSIQVGNTTSSPSNCRETECGSFECK